jgi:pimeloyl-ACP methyl ester carboxylesterase
VKFRIWRRVAALLFIGFSAPSVTWAQTPAAHKPAPHPAPATLEGSWAGSLQAGDALLHLVLHISKEPDGSFKATIDSLDQGVYGIPVDSLAQDDSNLTFKVSSVGASYAGTISADHRTVDGGWTQSSISLGLVFHREAANAGARKPSDAIATAEGVWQGAIAANGLRLRLQLHVTHDDKKQLLVALDSPDQGVSGLPAVKVSQKENSFHFEIPVVKGSYTGTLNPAKTVMTGSWTQSGVEQKLEFQRSDQLLPLLRPQDPVKPYPYKEEEVTFSNDQAHVSLSGTLTLPQGPGPFPVAILLSGSGPHDRDETIEGHRSFLVLADHLTRKGIAVLRFDKRGIGKSTGSYDSATIQDFAADAQSAVAYLKTRKDMDPKRIGLIGHSEGGLIAPIVASHSTDIAWVVLLAAPALKGEDILLLQSELIMKVAGIGEEQISRTLDFNKQTYALARQEKDPSALETKLNALVQSTGMGALVPPSTLQAQVRMMASPWFRYILDYDPLPALQKTLCPVLALNGQKDLQVPPRENLPRIQKTLQDAGNKDVQASELPGLNHLFQHAPTGSPAEYGGIEETMAPEALAAVSDWVLKHASP